MVIEEPVPGTEMSPSTAIFPPTSTLLCTNKSDVLVIPVTSNFAVGSVLPIPKLPP